MEEKILGAVESLKEEMLQAILELVKIDSVEAARG